GRDMTRWREWVIDAFNENLRFDQFTIEQLAGDLLPDPTTSQRIASGFNRNHMINFEGGAIPQEYHTAYIIDRVNTTGTVFLGLTVACVQCHDHKYDPISQREYYQLFAFFHNVPENGLDGSKGNASPMLRVASKTQQAELDRFAAAIRDLEKKLTDPHEELDRAQKAWESSPASQTIPWKPLENAQASSEGGATIKIMDDQSFLVSGTNPGTDQYTVSGTIKLQRITGIRLELLTDPSLTNQGPGRSVNGNVVLTDLRLAASESGAALQPQPLRQATADFSQKDYDVALAIDDNPQSGWAIHPEVGKPHAAAFNLSKPLEGKSLQIQLVMKYHSPHGQHQAGRFRVTVTDAENPRIDTTIPENIRQILARAAADRSADDQGALRGYYRTQVASTGRAWVAEIAKLKQDQAAIERAIPTAMVMQEMEKPRDTFVLTRGQYDKPGERVSAAVPAFLPPLPEGAPSNRLGLAKWLVAPSHPLMARVTVNRLWQSVFGVGIVKTAEDFGSQGELPTHPELLDWLAVEFRTGDSVLGSPWNVKQFVKMLVTSATYRQSSTVNPDLVARDPENRLLARGPRFRLSAEFIRDQALAVSGLLDQRIGGHSVSPYQPPGIWEELASRADGKNWTAQEYSQSHGIDLYRRTMYTFWKRTAPPPTLVTFDAPDRETCIVRRPRTNTPLQALILMNDPTYVEASRKLGERIMREGGKSTDERIAFAFRVVLGRRPQARERDVLEQVYQKQRALYAETESAANLLKVGEAPADANLDAQELAAWSMVASVLLNLDETVTKG
ncbi:MAG: hypothetical protein RIS70_1544, partial [Planctomycetota bacterium]